MYTINPLTHRKIKIGGPTFKHLPPKLQKDLLKPFLQKGGGECPIGKTTRLVPKIDDSTDLGNLFIHNNKTFADCNKYCQYNNHNFRIMTYNVHMWKGVTSDYTTWDKPPEHNINQILQVILTNQPDILCLEEVLYYEEAMSQLYQHYELLSLCSVNPTYTHNKPYMTMVCLKNGLREKFVEYATHDPIFASICGSRQRCFLGQKTDVLNAPLLTDAYAEDIEEKCYIKISLPAIDLICVHLSAYDNTGKIRISELQRIHEIIGTNRKTIILGDFNLESVQKFFSRKSISLKKFQNTFQL